MQSEHNNFKKQHTAQVEALQLDNRTKLENVTAELNETWSATLRYGNIDFFIGIYV